MSTLDPYPNAHQGWNERNGDSLFRAKKRRIATLAPGLAGISVAGVPYIWAQPDQLKRKKTDCQLTGLIDRFIGKGQP